MRKDLHRPSIDRANPAARSIVMMLYGENLVQSLKRRPSVPPHGETKAIDQDRTAPRH